jgi:hypothetical protein
MSVHLVGDAEIDRLVKEQEIKRQIEQSSQFIKKQLSIKRLKVLGGVLALLFAPIVGGLTYSLAHLMFGNEAISQIQGVVAGSGSFMMGMFSLVWHTTD